jgi:hypothetical protein
VILTQHIDDLFVERLNRRCRAPIPFFARAR